MFTVVTPLPQTQLYDLARRERLVTDDYWREFTLGNRKGQRIPYFFPDAEKWVKKAYMKFYLRPKFIFRKLIKIRSLGALKKHWLAFQGLFLFKMKGS